VIFDALRRGDAAYRAICHELLEHVVAVPIRDGMLALTSSGAPLERLRDALTFFEPEGSARLIELASGAGRVSELPDPDQRELEAVSSRVLGEAAWDPDTILAAVLAYQLPELVGPNRDEESARGG
jgi:hypothetical protein